MAMPAFQSGDSDFQEPELVEIPDGSFLMGSECGQENERPVHRVCLDAFSLARVQVTNREYHFFVRASGAPAPPFWNDVNFAQPEQPVVGVSWLEAVRYCEWLCLLSGKIYRLPSEAEWEYAARGGLDGAAFPWGDSAAATQPLYAERWHQGPELVGRSQPNRFGLFEMCENVHEWCSDWFDPDYYRNSPSHNPRGPERGERRASRGGSWRHHIKISRCAARSSIPPSFQYADYGFRVARSA